MNIAFNKTKVVATIGPATRTKEKVLELVHAGVNVFRMNFSHDTHEDHKPVFEWVREINDKFGYNIAILQDLQGPKIRIGDVENGAVEIHNGNQLVITNNPVVGTAEKVSTTYTSITKDVKVGDNILIDDGNLSVKVKEIKGDDIITEVIHGGMLKSRKGMNLPDTNISESSLTAKDKRDLEFGLENGVNWVALSFVRTAQDIQYVKDIINEKKAYAQVVAKIERPEAVRNFESILEVTDAVMVARGDLGVEIRMEDVPLVQKDIIEKCNHKAKPVIVATQMMESMISNPRPTRAEANDVANAVMDGADAVMLSAESAAGKFPVETVQSMIKIITAIERGAKSIYHKSYEFNRNSPNFIGNNIAQSASNISESVSAKAFIGITDTGFTAQRIARHRPKANIFIFSDNRNLVNTMNLVWGVRAFYYTPEKNSTIGTFNEMEKILSEKGFLSDGDVYINIAGLPIEEEKKTNMIKVSVVGGDY